jgi:hypothetical protein
LLLEGFYYSVPHGLIRAVRITSPLSCFITPSARRRYAGPWALIPTACRARMALRRMVARALPTVGRGLLGPNTEGLAALANRPHPERGLATRLGKLDQAGHELGPRSRPLPFVADEQVLIG